jgi:hypothetical protein
MVCPNSSRNLKKTIDVDFLLIVRLNSDVYRQKMTGFD